MSTLTRVSLAAAFAGIAIVVMTPGGWPTGDTSRWPEARKPGSPREKAYALLGTWRPNREVAVSWSVGGVKHGPVIDRVSPHERTGFAPVGTVLTITVMPRSTGGNGNEHSCVIEVGGVVQSPPGQRTGRNTEAITCTATIT